MKLSQSELEEEYEFWKLDKAGQIKAYLDYFLKEEVPDIDRYRKAPKAYQNLFRERCNYIYQIFKARANLEKELLDISSKNIAVLLFYIASGISHIGLTLVEFEKFYICISIATYRAKDRLLDYLLNKLDILDWYNFTLNNIFNKYFSSALSSNSTNIPPPLFINGHISF